MSQALLLQGQVYLHLHTSLYGGQYYNGQFMSFSNLAEAEAFLQAAPECVRLGPVRYQYPYTVYDVYPALGCYVQPPIIPPGYCPCAQQPIFY